MYVLNIDLSAYPGHFAASPDLPTNPSLSNGQPVSVKISPNLDLCPTCVQFAGEFI